MKDDRINIFYREEDEGYIANIPGLHKSNRNRSITENKLLLKGTKSAANLNASI